MDLNGTRFEHLQREECLRLMGQVPLGRIVYTRQALPAVELVNFTLDQGDTASGLRQPRRLERAVAYLNGYRSFGRDGVFPVPAR